MNRTIRILMFVLGVVLLLGGVYLAFWTTISLWVCLAGAVAAAVGFVLADIALQGRG